MNLPQRFRWRLVILPLLIFDGVMAYVVYFAPSSVAPSRPQEEILGQEVQEPSSLEQNTAAPNPQNSNPGPVISLSPIAGTPPAASVEPTEITTANNDSNYDAGSSSDSSSNSSVTSNPSSGTSSSKSTSAASSSDGSSAPSATASATLIARSLTNTAKLLDLYTLLSQEISTVFPTDAWREAVSGAGLEVTAAETLGETVVSGDWAEQKVRLTTADGQVTTYSMVLKKEDGQWKLFGTIEE